MNWLAERLELSRGGSHNLLPMEGLRGVAVFMVFLVHYATLSAPWFAGVGWLAAGADALHEIGNSGVDLFFVLSGYLIYGTLMRRPQPFGRFMLRRARRIYPAFLVVFALYLALALASPSLGKLPPQGRGVYIAENLLLLPGLFPIEPLITVAWSLSYEMFYYLAVPLLIAGLRLRSWTPGQRIAFLLALAAALAGYGLVTAGPLRLMMFIAGMLLHELPAFTRARPLPALALAAASAAFLARALPTVGSAGFSLKIVALFIGFGLLCWSTLAEPRSWLGRGLAWTPLRWLGNMSYSYYLAHSLGLKLAFGVGAALLPPARWGTAGGMLMLPLSFAVSLVPSLLLYLAVERPLSLVPGLRKAPATAEPA
ncbi:MAG: acyltransferase [Burkholderiales bacterium]|nr:acyltransferase [Burkholderiales bacterium]